MGPLLQDLLAHLGKRGPFERKKKKNDLLKTNGWERDGQKKTCLSARERKIADGGGERETRGKIEAEGEDRREKEWLVRLAANLTDEGGGFNKNQRKLKNWGEGRRFNLHELPLQVEDTAETPPGAQSVITDAQKGGGKGTMIPKLNQGIGAKRKKRKKGWKWGETPRRMLGR